ncbi:MAG: 50S ribosomal protein L6 [Spirochaetes bacterium RBG_13_51_14]|nr:MAG: 50S ribosomal protein L6 [Spirochaetes bacterium RBG_13_51_14]
MSRVGRKPVNIPNGVSVDYGDKILIVKGPLGEEKLTLMDGIDLVIKDNVIRITVGNATEDKKDAASAGLMRSLVSNMVTGVSKGYEKHMEIVGVGYRVMQQNKDVQFQLGFSHPILFSTPAGIIIEVLEATKFKIKGANKQQVGQVAANIRKLRPPEPYKGKGIRYKDEHVRKKAGKTGK